MLAGSTSARCIVDQKKLGKKERKRGGAITLSTYNAPE